jgi:hypothetical protein
MRLLGLPHIKAVIARHAGDGVSGYFFRAAVKYFTPTGNSGGYFVPF